MDRVQEQQVAKVEWVQKRGLEMKERSPLVSYNDAYVRGGQTGMTGWFGLLVFVPSLRTWVVTVLYYLGEYEYQLNARL